MGVRGLQSIVIAVGLIAVAAGCGHREATRLTKASRAMGKAVAKGDAAEVRTHIVAGAAGTVDVEGMLAGTARKSWSRSLAKPDEVQPRAIVFIEPQYPVEVVWTDDGWRFAEDPTDVYAADTPRHAVRALVVASRRQRWDVLLRLAPQRYRTGLSVDDLKKAWTEGEHATALRAARDRLADRVANPILSDAHEAALDLGDGDVARLEREGDRWVVVDF